MVHVLVTTIVIAFILGTVSVPGALGRDCYGADIFKGSDYTFAAIPTECNTLDLRNSNGGAGGATAVAVVTAIDANTVPTAIADGGAIAIAKALKLNTCALTKLSLQNNNIGDVGATALAGALKVNTALKTLHLYGNNDIGDSGALAIAAALKVNTALTNLNLYNNKIGDKGVIALCHTLAAALKVNTVLTKLYLSRCKIGHLDQPDFCGILPNSARFLQKDDRNR